MQEGQFDQAIPLSVNLIEQLGSKATFEDWFANGVCHFKLDQNTEAVESYNKALALDSKNFQAMANKGISLLRLDRVDEAFRSFREAFSMCPDIGPAWLNIAFYHMANSDKIALAYEKAVNAFRRAVKVCPPFGEARVYMPQLEAYGTVGYLLNFAESVPDIEDEKVLAPDR